MRHIVPVVLAAAAAASCGGSNNPSPSPSPSPGSPSPSSSRLAWTQAAPSASSVQGYDFILFIDGTRTVLSTPTCTGAAPAFECVAPLPALTGGRHVLELASLDRSTGRESARSAQLIIGSAASADLGVIDQVAANAAETTGGGDDVSVSCSDGAAPVCVDMSVVADNLGAIERLVSLPDGRLLAIHPGNVVRFVPDGIAERLELDRSGAARIADIAVDPGFLTNRFMYFATTTPAAAGRSAVSIVRMREVGGRFGEAATVAADLPADGTGSAAISMGPDGRIYAALPSNGQRSTGGPYDGLVLRLTREGSAAGDDRMHSPILALGSPRPSSLGWMDEGHLLLASSDGRLAAALGMVAPGGTWPAALTPLRVPDAAPFADGIKQVAADPGAGGSSRASRLYLLGGEPLRLYVARLEGAAGTPPAINSIDPLFLGGFLPVTFTLAGDGTLLVAAREDGDPRVRLLRLHVRS